MSLFQKPPENLTKALIYQRIAAAQKLAFPWDKTALKTRELVQAHANSLGCPDEYLFFPLITVAASFIGTKGSIKLNDSWEEPAIAWFNVCARKGQKKTAALNVLAKPVKDIQEDLQKDYREENEDAQEKDLPRLLVDHFSFEKLHQIMSANRNKTLGAYDELTQFYNMLDHYKTNSTMDRKTLLSLNGGGQWTRDFKNGSATMNTTCLNITGYIQPAYVVRILAQDDFDGFNDRQLYVCPAERDVDYAELVPLDPSSQPQLKAVYQIIQNCHADDVTYTFDEEAHAIFRGYHDELKRRKLAIKHDENRRGIIAKAIGQMARVSMIVHVLDSAVDCADQEMRDGGTEISIPTVVGKESAHQAVAVINYVIDTKLSTMPPEETIPQEDLAQFCASAANMNDQRSTLEDEFHPETLTDIHGRYVKKVILSKGESIKASEVLGLHLMPPVTPPPGTKNKYPTMAAEKFLSCMETLGLGHIEKQTSNGRSKETCFFRKRKFHDMSTETKNKLRKLNISEEQYAESMAGSDD